MLIFLLKSLLNCRYENKALLKKTKCFIWNPEIYPGERVKYQIAGAKVAIMKKH